MDKYLKLSQAITDRVAVNKGTVEITSKEALEIINCLVRMSTIQQILDDDKSE